MSKKIVSWALVVCVMLVCSCSQKGGKGYHEKNFTTEQSLTADSVEIGTIIKSGCIYTAGSYVVVSDVEASREFNFAVFDKDLKYLYSFSEYGDGPEACIMPTVVKNTPNGKFLVRDHATGRYHAYQLSDTGAVATEQFVIHDITSPDRSLFEINYVDKDLYLAKEVGARSAQRKLVDFQLNATVDSLSQTFDLQATMGKDYYSEFDDCWISASGNNFACAYFFIDRIEFGAVDGNSMQLTDYVGTDEAPEFHIYTDETLTGKFENNVDYNVVYYEWLYASETGVYATYFGAEWGDIDRHSSIIEWYSLDGKPQAKYNLNVPLATFVVVGDKIIGLNPERSDDMFYIYRK